MPKEEHFQEGLALKEIRMYLGLSQDGFAALLGSTKSTISRRENGSNPMLRLTEVVRLEDALAESGKSIKDFMTPQEKEDA